MLYKGNWASTCLWFAQLILESCIWHVQLYPQFFYRHSWMTFLAVFAEQVLPRLLVVALSAPYCWRAMHGVDVSRLLPFSGKVLSAVFDSADEPCLLPVYAITRRVVSLSGTPGNGTMLQFVVMESGMSLWLRLHGIRQKVVIILCRDRWVAL